MTIKRFELHRETDISGISGTGIIAEGVEFSDGIVHLRWLGSTPTSVVFQDGIEAVERIHGHNGATRIVWVKDEPSDDFHTLTELYEYRMLYNAHAANLWANKNIYPVAKSWRHSDGELCFGGGWFIVVANLPTGQVSNHYEAQHWDLFDVPEVELPPEYDGHTSQIAAERLHWALRDKRYGE